MHDDCAAPGVAERQSVGFAPYAFITLVYTLAHGLSLLNRGMYWDDWVFWRQDMSVVALQLKAMGSTWPAAINRLFYYSQSGITLDRALAFVSLLAVALFLFDTVRRLPGLTASASLWIAVVFSVFPVYQARIALVLVGYELCLALFAAAVWLLVRFGPRVWVQIAAALLLLTAFQTASLLVLFYAVVPAVLLALDPPDTWTVRNLWTKLRGSVVLLGLPLLYWGVKRIWFRPSGLYVDYNQVGSGSTGFVGDLVHGIVNSTVYSVLEALPGAVKLGIVHPGLKPLLLAGAVAAVVVVLGLIRWPLERTARDSWLMHAGLVLLVAAVLPYAAVGKVQMNDGWETRHQLLVPIGAAFFIVGWAQSHMRAKRTRAVLLAVLLAGLVGVSVGRHVNSYIDYQRDWFKQKAMIVLFRDTPEIRRGRYIIFNDHTQYLNQTSWDSYPYQYNGMLAEAFGDEKRVGLSYMPGGTWWTYAPARPLFYHQPYYKTGEYDGQGPDYVVTIRKGKLDLTSGGTVLRLMMLDWIDRPKLDRELKGALIFQVEKYRSEYSEKHYAPESK